MSDTVKINVVPRTETGSSNGRRLRREGSFPGIVYGSGTDTELVKVNEHQFRKDLAGHSNEHVLLDLDIEGKGVKKVILQEVQHDALTGKILHADFHEVSMTEKLKVEVKLELVGKPIGVTQDGGILEHPIRTVEVECLPGDLMDSIEVDVSELRIGDHLSVKDIKLDLSKYELITDPETSVAAVAEPTKEIEPETAEGEEVAEGEEAAEGAEAGSEEKKEDEAPAKDSE